MRIRELTLRNYRVFGAEQSFALSDRVTVIAGVNGKGKTTILDALALLASRLLPLISPARSGYRTMKGAEIHGDEAESDLTMKVNCAGIPIEFKLNYEREANRLRRNTIPMAVRDTVKNIYGDPRRAGDQAPLAVYYTTDRAGFRVPKNLPSNLPRGQELAYVRALRARLVDYRAMMAQYRVWAGADGSPRNVAAFSSAVGGFLEGFSQMRIEASPPRLSLLKGLQRVVVEQLSDGERSLLAIVADLVRRLALANPELPDPLQGAGVVLIDEIELHLHPTWQRSVVEKLRTTFPNVQFIATTHSPFVIQSLRPGELINLDSGEQEDFVENSIEDIAERVMGVDLPQKSKRFQDMVAAAEEYYSVLEEAAVANGADIEPFKRRLDELALPYGDDPAYAAFLQFQRNRMLR